MKQLFLFAILFLSTVVGYAQTTAVAEPLKGYIETALAQNPDVQATRARWKNTDAQVHVASSYLYPRVDFSSKFSQFQGGRIVNIPNVGNFNTAALAIVPWDNQFTASWSIGNFALWQGLSVSEAYRNASSAEVSAKELAITYDVSEAYYMYAKAKGVVSVRKNAEALAEENLKVANALFANSKAPKNDVLRADVAVASAQGEVLSAENMATLAKTHFNNLLKRDYDAEVNVPSVDDLSNLSVMRPDLASSSTEQTSPLPPLGEDAEKAYANRPEVQQIMSTGEALGARKREVFSDYLPNVSLFASYGWSENSLQFSNTNHLFIGGAQLKWNLFSGFNTNAKMQEVDATIEELRFHAESAYNSIRVDLVSARLGKVNAMERLAIAKKQIASAEENYRITKAQYENGMALLITMLDAQTTLASAKANLATTIADVLIADAKYRKELGVR